MSLLQIFGKEPINLLKILKEKRNNLNAVIKELLIGQSLYPTLNQLIIESNFLKVYS